MCLALEIDNLNIKIREDENYKSTKEELRERSCVTGKELVFTNTTFSRMSQHGALCREERVTWVLLGFARQTSVLSVSDASSSSPDRQMSPSDGGQPCQSDTDSSVEESDFDTMPDIESDKNIIRTKVPLPGHAL